MTTKKQQHELDRREREAEDKGFWFRVHWNEGGYSFGPQYKGSREDALKNVDDMITRKRIEIPDDIHARRGHLVHMVVHIEAFRDGQWVRVEGSEKSCICRVDYPDT